MKTLAAILAAALLCGCQRQAAPSALPNGLTFSNALVLAEWLGPRAAVLATSNAIAGASNRAQAEADFAAMVDKLAVESLVRMSPGELARRADTVKRGTSQSPYTAAQIEAARKAKGVQ